MSKASTNRQIMDAAWDEVFDLRARIAEAEALRKARFAWANPDGRESIRMTTAEKTGLLAIALMLGLMMGWIGS